MTNENDPEIVPVLPVPAKIDTVIIPAPVIIPATPPDIPKIVRYYNCPNCQDEIEYTILKLWAGSREFTTECNTCGFSVRLRSKDRPFLEDRLDRFNENRK